VITIITLTLIIMFVLKDKEPINEAKANSTEPYLMLNNQIDTTNISDITETSGTIKMNEADQEELEELSPEEMLDETFRNDFKDFANYISPLEEIISLYDTEEHSDLMQELFEIISNDLDTAEKITDAINNEDFKILGYEEKQSFLDRMGFYMITSPYVMSRLYSNLLPEDQAVVNKNLNSEAIVEPVVLKKVYEIKNGRSDEYEFKSKSPNNKYYKVIMEIANKESELYKKQGNYVIYLYSNKEARQAEIEYVFCVDQADQLNQSPLAGSFYLNDFINP